MKIRLIAASSLAVLLCACGGSASQVSGNQDDVKTVKAQYKTVTQRTNVYSRSCSKGKCKSVKTGVKTMQVRKKVRDTKYCVELDNVNGKSDNDDAWFTVTSSEYYKALKRDEGDKVSKMSYNTRGC